MTAKKLHCLSIVAAIVLATSYSSESRAQCCSAATTAYYQPAAYTAYSPVVYQSNYSGWYPGYYLDRIRMRMWGAPSTYVASYPTTYTAAYPTSYVSSYPAYSSSYAMSYAPVSAASTCSTCTANYSPCTTCSPAQQVTLRPVCGCDPCSSCASCSSYGVTQTSYEEPSGCASCSGGTSGATIIESNGATMVPEATGAGQPTGQPQIPANEPTAEERSTLKVPDASDASKQQVEPAPPAGGTTPPAEAPPAAEGSNAQFFEAPQLFNPNDRTAQRHVAPVRNALYEQPVGYRQVAVPGNSRITAEQARRDAAGWKSASN